MRGRGVCALCFLQSVRMRLKRWEMAKHSWKKSGKECVSARKHFVLSAKYSSHSRNGLGSAARTCWRWNFSGEIGRRVGEWLDRGGESRVSDVALNSFGQQSGYCL